VGTQDFLRAKISFANRARHLLVADENIAPGENVEQFPVAPKIAPVVPERAAGFDYEFVLHSTEHGARSTEQES
jgi:hypothetical protein